MDIQPSPIKESVRVFYERFVKEKIFYRTAQDDFYRVLGGHIFFAALSAGVELDLFNLIESRRRMTLREISSALRIAEQPCRILLLTLVSGRMLKRRGQWYHNSLAARRFLTKDAPWKYADCVRWQDQINYRALQRFLDAIRENKNVGLEEVPGEGKTLYEKLSHQPHLEHVFQNAMQEISRQSNGYLASVPHFSQVQRVLDIGGGNGTNAIRLVSTFPGLEAAVFDIPSVCEIARTNIEKHHLSSRVKAISGEIFSDPLPTGFDCILFCHFLTIWSKEENLVLLRKACRALPARGSVVVFNMMQHDDESGPLLAAIGSPYFLTLATGRGMLYTWREYEELMAEAGFSRVVRKVLPRDHGVVIGIK